MKFTDSKTFEENCHTLIGLDEMCPMSNSHGDLQVVASADKKKQKKLLQDSHCFITVVRTGTMAGTMGPTYFLLKVTQCKNNFNDDYLRLMATKRTSSFLTCSRMADDDLDISSGVSGSSGERDDDHAVLSQPVVHTIVKYW